MTNNIIVDLVDKQETQASCDYTSIDVYCLLTINRTYANKNESIAINRLGMLSILVRHCP
jgi:hypothetical protein